MKKYLLLISAFAVVSTLKAPLQIPIPMTEGHWNILTTSPKITKFGSLAIYDFQTDWSEWDKFLTDSLKGYEKKRLIVIGIDGPYVRYASLGVSGNERRGGVWVPLDSAWKKIQTLLKSLDTETLQKYAQPPKTIHRSIGDPIQHSFSIEIAWYFEDYSAALGGYPIDTKQIFLPKNLPSSHPFVLNLDTAVKQFINVALKEYPPTFQVNPNYPPEEVAKWDEKERLRYSDKFTVLNERQVQYIDCLVEKASGKNITCKRP